MTSEIERNALRARIRQLLTNGLPLLIDVPVPLAVRDADWFREAKLKDILRVYAFPAFQIPVFSGKIFPAWAMLLADEAAGKFRDWPAVAGSSSGNFIKDLANAARAFTIKKVYAVVNRNLPAGKVHHVAFAGAEIVYAPEGMTATEYAYRFAKEKGCVLEDQYVREDAIKGHELGMNHIARGMKELTGDAGFIVGAVTGTCSTLMAARRYLPPQFAGPVKVLGVASMSKAEKVPGSRAPENLQELRGIGGFGWQLYEHPEQFLDFPIVTSVTKEESYALNAELVQQSAIPVGPTGALLEAGFYHLLRERVERGEVDSLKNRDGMIAAVLFWMDSYLAYIDNEEYLHSFRH